jgi:hypothetical protein
MSYKYHVNYVIRLYMSYHDSDPPQSYHNVKIDQIDHVYHVIIITYHNYVNHYNSYLMV